MQRLIHGCQVRELGSVNNRRAARSVEGAIETLPTALPAHVDPQASIPAADNIACCA